MKDFRPLKPNCLLFNDLDIRQLLNIVGLENILTKDDIEKLLLKLLRDVSDGVVYKSSNADWNIEDENDPSYIYNKPTDLVHNEELLNALSNYLLKSLYLQPDWNQDDDLKSDYIKNKPQLHEVAITGDYTKLKNTPTLEINRLLETVRNLDQTNLISKLDEILGRIHTNENGQNIDGYQPEQNGYNSGNITEEGWYNPIISGRPDPSDEDETYLLYMSSDGSLICWSNKYSGKCFHRTHKDTNSTWILIGFPSKILSEAEYESLGDNIDPNIMYFVKENE